MIMHNSVSTQPPTVADLEEYGAQACLEALREEFAGAHKRYDQYRNWTAGTVLGVVEQRIGGNGTFVRAEPGDLVLVKRDRYRPWIGCTPDHVAYVPRVGWNVAIGMVAVRDITPAGESR